jgi:hypothetical protein
MSAGELLERLRAARLHAQWTFPDLDALVRGSIGLHSTDYATPYLSARARLPGFAPADLFRRLSTAHGLVRVNAFRNTVHVVHVDDLPAVLAATGAAVAQVGRKQPGLAPLSDAAFEAGLAAVAAALAGGPRTTEQLKAALPAQAADLRFWLLAAMGRGTVIRADAANPRSNRTRYAAVSSWVPGFRPDVRPAVEVRRELLGRAVRTFGPTTVEDLAWWLPAPKGEVTRALAATPGLASVAVDGRTWWYERELADREPPPRERHGVWLLPYEDALLKGYLDRSWLLAPGLREVVFPSHPTHWRPPDGVSPGPGPHRGINASGEARPTVWWRGRVVGRWEQEDGRVVWQLHADLDPTARAAVADEVARLERFLGELSSLAA